MDNKQEILTMTILDAMVEHLLAYQEIPFLDLVQALWRKGLDIELTPPPENESHLRQALKACILERAAEIWSSPPKNLPTKPPAWCKDIPPLNEHFSVIPPEFSTFWRNEKPSPIFAKRNIFAPSEFMFFL